MTPAQMDDLVNGGEIIVWIVIAAVVAHKAITARRKDHWLPAFSFFAFGISDAVEMTTGAWWKPWWLVVWKVTCLFFIGRFFWHALREYRKK